MNNSFANESRREIEKRLKTQEEYAEIRRTRKEFPVTTKLLKRVWMSNPKNIITTENLFRIAKNKPMSNSEFKNKLNKIEIDNFLKTQSTENKSKSKTRRKFKYTSLHEPENENTGWSRKKANTYSIDKSGKLTSNKKNPENLITMEKWFKKYKEVNTRV